MYFFVFRFIFLFYVFWWFIEFFFYCVFYGYEKMCNILNIIYEMKRILFLFCLFLFLLIVMKCEWFIIEILKCVDCVE